MNKIKNIQRDYNIQEIKKNMSILDVANEFGLKLKRSGKSYFTLCPMHVEQTASCSLVPNSDSTKDYFYCFGCEAGGDQINLFASLSPMSNREAINYLANRYGLSQEQPLPEPIVREYARNKRDRSVERNFLINYKQVFYDLCTIRDSVNNLIKQYEFIELLVDDELVIKYYQDKEHYEEILERLQEGLFEKINFNKQIEVFIEAKGVLTKWKKLLQKR
ncbi:CHC2 zinc finger domain-containing protein [Neobacillus sp. NRS-1170]|uniref:CHC2 zinc finger domain-containing protein n=1 Tax=Neobacillus sp. NRS-1170 TaxID=3233898 RepID=UPI003D2A982F